MFLIFDVKVVFFLHLTKKNRSYFQSNNLIFKMFNFFYT